MGFQSTLARMHSRLLARMGEPAVLRGSVDCLANIEHGVVVNYEVGDAKFIQSEYAATVDVANIQTEFNPTPGDTLLVGGTTYVIDVIASDNGYLTRCILR